MKVCFVCNEYPPARCGGIGSMTRTLARGLIQGGHDVRVIGLKQADETVAEFETDEGVQIWRLNEPEGRLGWLWGRYKLYRTIVHWAQLGLIDLVEVPDFQGLAAGWPSLAVPVITRMHGSGTYFAIEMGDRQHRNRSRLERASLRRADFLCSCSRYTADRTAKLFGLRKEISVIHNPVVTGESTARVDRSANRVVFSGTLAAKKGVISLIQAWNIVSAKQSDAELHIFGKDGRTCSGMSMKDYLVSCLSADARKTVQFHGHVDADQMRSAFQAARLAVFPSYSEAFALGPMEAMAQSCATIYTSRCSGPELIQDGENGLLVDPDFPDQIAKSIIRLLDDSDLAARLGTAGRKCIEQSFSLSVLMERNLRFYESCVRSHFGPANFDREVADSPVAGLAQGN